jgi:hypothetical protein
MEKLCAHTGWRKQRCAHPGCKKFSPILVVEDDNEDGWLCSRHTLECELEQFRNKGGKPS